LGCLTSGGRALSGMAHTPVAPATMNPRFIAGAVWNPVITALLIGASKVSQLEENLAASKNPLRGAGEPNAIEQVPAE